MSDKDKKELDRLCKKHRRYQKDVIEALFKVHKEYPNVIEKYL